MLNDMQKKLNHEAFQQFKYYFAILNNIQCKTHSIWIKK
jgi:hypothetical protein